MAAFFQRVGEFLYLFPTARYALIVGVLIALCSSLLGVTLVLKRFSFIGDGLSHVAFGAMAVAAVVGLTNQMLIVMPVTVVSAILLLRTGQNSRIKGDASVAIISVFALAFGYLMMNLFSPTGSNVNSDVCGTLFGTTKIIFLSTREVYICAGLSLLTALAFVFFYNRIFAVTFDENFAKATGIKAEVYNLIIAVIIAVVIVLAMTFVGSLLISALIIFPALAAMRLCKSFLSVTICATATSVVTAFIGLIISMGFSGLPVGPTIVVVQAIAFLVFYIVGFIKGRVRA